MRESYETVYVTEKKSVAATLSGVVGARAREQGFFEGDGIAVTWCSGHIVELAPPDGYDGWAKWDAGCLPMVPAEWSFLPREGAQGQCETVCELLRRAGRIVCATDGDREGEGIFRRVYSFAGASAPVERLWASSTEPAALVAALGQMRPGTDYDGLAAAAMARAKADWLVGMNASRAYTLAASSSKPLSIGRVKTPTLAMVAARDAEIAGFEPEPFWTVVADMGLWQAASERLGSAPFAAAVAMGRIGELRVASAEYGPAEVRPPLPYNLDELMKDASRLFGYTPKQTLDAAQLLYEKRLQTYPRTSSRHIEPADVPGARECVRALAGGEGSPVACAPFEPDFDRIADSSKVEGHPAILPTRTLMEVGWADLGERERNVSALVCLRLVASVAPPWRKREGKVALDGIAYDGTRVRFAASGFATEDDGWKGIVDATLERIGAKAAKPEQQAIPPKCEVGQPVTPQRFELKEGKTKAPAAYTDATLLTAMETCGRSLDDEQLAAALKGRGIGTAATRAAIIEELLRAGQIERSKGKIRSTELGRTVAASVSPQLASPELTGEWEARLADMRALGDEDAFVADAAGYASSLVSDAFGRESELRARFGAAGRHVVCKCPRCGREVVRTGADGKGAVVRCSSVTTRRNESGAWEDAGGCGLKVWAKVAGVTLTDEQIAAAIAGERVKVDGIKPKDPSKKSYSRFMTLDMSAGDDSGCCKWVYGEFANAPAKPGTGERGGKPFGGRAWAK